MQHVTKYYLSEKAFNVITSQENPFFALRAFYNLLQGENVFYDLGTAKYIVDKIAVGEYKKVIKNGRRCYTVKLQ